MISDIQIALVIAGSIIAIYVLYYLIKFLVIEIYWGARALLEAANKQGFIGIAAYITCWVFMLPIMLIVSFFVGLYPNLITNKYIKQLNDDS